MLKGLWTSSETVWYFNNSHPLSPVDRKVERIRKARCINWFLQPLIKNYLHYLILVALEFWLRTWFGSPKLTASLLRGRAIMWKTLHSLPCLVISSPGKREDISFAIYLQMQECDDNNGWFLLTQQGCSIDSESQGLKGKWGKCPVVPSPASSATSPSWLPSPTVKS